ncbi:MAG: hypothetical protein MH204_05615 [Fimbriimonadaceae bacterium]|nr:hypothetical protein [Fimbriimonadaceae bacterium]
MDLVIDWDRPVTEWEARQTQRRLLDALVLEAAEFHPREPFAECRLQSAQAARVLPILHPPVAEPED